MKKNIGKRILSLALALVMVAGWLPHMATEAHAAEPITLSGDTYNTNPGEGFTMEAYGYCYTCMKSIYLDSDIPNHSFEIVSFSYTITDTGFTTTMTCTVKGCNGSKTYTNTQFNSTFEEGVYHDSDCTSGASGFRSIADWDVNLGAWVTVEREPVPHRGNATCVTSGTCTVCGKTYKASHDYDTEKWSVDKNTKKHYHACKTSGCTSRSDEADCTYSDATCTEPSACSVCEYVYAVKLGHSYTYTADGFVLTETCTNGCGHQAIASIVAGEAIYTGSEITDAATISYDSGTWGGDAPVLSFENNVTVGTATAKMTAGDATASTTFKINPANLSNVTVTLDPASGIYNGEFHSKPSYNLTYNGKELKEGTDYTVEGGWTGDFTNAGNHTLMLEGTGNFTGGKTLCYTIGRANPTKAMFAVQWPEYLDYDGTTTFPVTVTSNNPELGEITAVKYNGSTDAPVNAGTYTVTVDVAEGKNYSAATVELGTFAVAPTAGSIIIPANQSVVYDGAAVEQSDLTPAITTDGALTVKWYDSEGNEIDAPTDVGTYQIGISAAAGSNYNAVDEVKQTFTITKADPICTAPAAISGLVYNGKEQYLITSAVSMDGTVYYSLDGINYTESLPVAVNAQEYTVYYKVVGDANHNDMEPKTVTATIAPLNIGTASIKGGVLGGPFTYNGQKHTPDVQIDVSIPSGEANVPSAEVRLTEDTDYTVTYSDNVNAGQAVVTFTGKGNYTGTITKNFTIDPKPITVTIADKTSVYGEAVAELTATADGIVNNDPNVYSLATTATSTANAGTYPITGTTLNNNYKITFVDGTYTVTKATNQWTTEPSITGWTYDETASAPTVAAKCGNVTVAYAEKGKENFTAEVPTQAGDYTAKFTVTGNDNYNGLEETRDFTIAKKALSVTEVVATGREYDGTKTVAITEVTLDGIKTEDTVAVDLTGLTGTLESADKGTYTSVTLPELTLKDDKGNYTLTQPTAAVKTNVEITAKPITVTVADIADQTWTGSALSPAVVSPTELVKETDEFCTVTYTDNTNVGLATVNVEEKGNYTFTAIEKTFLIVPNESLIDGLTTANVTSADKTDVDKAVAMMNNADLNDAPAEDKADWEALKTLANALQERIDAADAADQTRNIQDAENIGAGNVKLDQRQDLEDALKDLEAAKENYSGNYTQEEKAALEADIKRIEDALAAIERVEDFNAAIDDSLLKEDVKTDMDAATEAAIKDAQAAYGELTDYEKTLIDPADKTKLDTLVATITAYKITKGDGGRCTVGSGKTLSFTANGPVRKFDYVQVNGKTIASSNYTVTEGSTIITLKSSYLDKLGYGKHKIQIFYTDGATDVANFRIYMNGGNPFTGDNTHMLFFAGIMMTSLLCMGMMVMFVAKKKGKYQR